MGIFHFSQIMANPSCGRFANPPTSQNFPKKKKKPNPNPIMHHLLLSPSPSLQKLQSQEEAVTSSSST
jgi:hypothetical protein